MFLAPSLLYEIALVVCVVILGILVGAKRFTVRMAAVYAGMVVLHIIGTNYLTGTLQIAIVTFTVFIRKIFPCAMLGCRSNRQKSTDPSGPNSGMYLCSDDDVSTESGG